MYKNVLAVNIVKNIALIKPGWITVVLLEVEEGNWKNARPMFGLSRAVF